MGIKKNIFFLFILFTIFSCKYDFDNPLEREKGGSLKGKAVYDQGGGKLQGLSGCLIHLLGTTLTVQSDEQGKFAIANVPAVESMIDSHTLHIKCTHPEEKDRKWGLQMRRRSIVVREGDAVNIGPVTMAKAGDISGSVAPFESGDKLGIKVVLANTNWSIFTDMEGKFFLRRVPAGDYVLVAAAISRPHLGLGVFKGLKMKVNKDMELEKPVGMEFKEDGKGNLSGRLVIPNIQDYSGLKIILLGGNKVEGDVSPDGSYQLNDVPEGIYMLKASGTVERDEVESKSLLPSWLRKSLTVSYEGYFSNVVVLDGEDTQVENVYPARKEDEGGDGDGDGEKHVVDCDGDGKADQVDLDKECNDTAACDLDNDNDGIVNKEEDRECWCNPLGFRYNKQLEACVEAMEVEGNHPPVANAGEDILNSQVGKEEQFDGSKSFDVDEGDKLIYQWSLLEKPKGSGTKIEEKDQVKCKLILDKVGKYRVSLIVTDGKLYGQPDLVDLYAQSKGEICDNWDNDGDGETDEKMVAPEPVLTKGVCKGSKQECDGKGWVEPDYTKIQGYEKAEILCDGKDNDCDGDIDEGLTANDAKNIKGVCLGQKLVCDGAKGWVEPDYTKIKDYEQTETLCDGMDNDCDGKIDEELKAPAATKTAGVCAGQTKVCGGTKGWQDPDYTKIKDYEKVETLCDGLDNDCYGDIDEGLEILPLPEGQNDCLGQGVCADLAQKVCKGQGGWQCDYSGLRNWEAEEISCDEKDNDCDGQTDEGLTNACGGCAALANQVGVTCDSPQDSDFCPDYYSEGGYAAESDATEDCPEGGCDQHSVWTCDPQNPNVVYCKANEFTNYTESCTGQDDDCDGKTDENDPDLIVPTAQKYQGVCQDSKKVCESYEGGKNWQEPDYSQITGYQEYETLCDGLDNDCDGKTDADDNNFEIIPLASKNRGVCQGQYKVCSASGWQDPDYTTIEGYEQTETLCDGIDNDCDGQIDEELQAQPADNCIKNGVCAQLLYKSCLGTSGWQCDYTILSDYLENENSCGNLDSLDNDCDGEVDEGDAINACGGCGSLVGTPGQLCDSPDDTDSCVDNYYDGNTEEPSMWTCSQDKTAVTCPTTTLSNKSETCNGQDDDCDGKTDEDFLYDDSGASKKIAVLCQGKGQCPDGVVECSTDGLKAVCSTLPGGSSYYAEGEWCDSQDNDCDGLTDADDPDLSANLSERQQGVCQGSKMVCNGGQEQDPDYTKITGYEATETLCDGLDNDCDGKTDAQDTHLQAVRPEADKIVGVCQGAKKECVNSQWQEPDYTQHSTDYDVNEDYHCNDRKDNDCDGEVDNSDQDCIDCPGHPGMVRNAPGEHECIDIYESSVWEKPCTGAQQTQYGVSSDDYPAGFPDNVGSEGGGTQTTKLYACSIKDVYPSTYLTYYQAYQACQNSQKELCYKYTWPWACKNGDTATTYPYGSTYGANICYDSQANGPAKTGSHSQCKNQMGAMDMSGNVREYTYIYTDKTVYGGHWEDGSANVQCESSQVRDPLIVDKYTGFRCCFTGEVSQD